MVVIYTQVSIDAAYSKVNCEKYKGGVYERIELMLYPLFSHFRLP